jgi:pimeloyl-ACP methyl ester carboxylesterase
MKHTPVKRRTLAATAMLSVTALTLTACSALFPFTWFLDSEQAKDLSEGFVTAEEYYAQTPEWSDCGGTMECATVVAPLDWENVSAEQPVSLKLTRQQATGTERLGSVFVNPGGPGASGADFVANGVNRAASAELQQYYDVVGWDPRGVAASDGVQCYDAAGMDEYLYGIAENTPRTDAWLGEVRESAVAYGEACAEASGDLLGYVDTVSTAHDLDMLRSVVGDNKLNYIGYSYGTLVGAYYAELFPENVGRMVLDGVVNPTATIFDMVLFQTTAFEKSLESYVKWCLAGSDCPFNGTVDQAMRSVQILLEKVEATPLEGADGRMLGVNTLLTAIIFPLYDEGSWSYLTDLFNELKIGETQMAFALADAYYSRDRDGTYLDNSNEAFSAINCLDYERVTDLDVMRKNAQAIADAAPVFGKYQGFGELGCADWPVPEKTLRTEITAPGSAPILVVGTTGDPATPYQWAVDLAASLENAALVTYNGEGHTAYNRSNACVLNTVDDYLIRGVIPATDPQC